MRTKTTVFQIADDFDIHSKVFTEDGRQVKDITLEWDGFLSGEGYELRLSDGSNLLVMPHFFVYVEEGKIKENVMAESEFENELDRQWQEELNYGSNMDDYFENEEH